MFDFHEKRRWKGRLYSKYVAGALFLVAALLSLSVYERYEAERKMAGKRQEMADELATLKQRAAVLETEVGRLKSDRGIEEEIRDRYEVAKNGEQVVVILGDDVRKKDQESTTTPEAKVVEEESFWSRWWHQGYFGTIETQ